MKLFFIIMVFSLSLFGAGIKWEKEYNTALKHAKEQNKPLLFIVSNHNCRYCVQLESTTLKNPQVIKTVNADYVALVVYVDEDPVFPHDLYVGGTPAIWFLYGNGTPMFQPIMGAVDSDSFLKALGLVKQEYKKVKQ
jgi:thioredoxin-related protein